MKISTMRTVRPLLAWLAAGSSIGACFAWNASQAQTTATRKRNEAGTQTATAKIVKAANDFLATLGEPQRKRTLFAFNDEQQRARWSNFPTGIVQRGGLNMGELTPAQRSAAMTLVASALSRRGFEKVQQIVEADEVLKQTEGAGGRNGAGLPAAGVLAEGRVVEDRAAGRRMAVFPAGGHPMEGRRSGADALPCPARIIRGAEAGLAADCCSAKTCITSPSWERLRKKNPGCCSSEAIISPLTSPSLARRASLTPSLTGAQPALYTVGGKTVRPLGQESDKALALLNALDETQRKQAILNYRMADLALGPGQDGKTILPEGLKVSAMNEKQRAMLLDVVTEWAGIVHESAATARLAEIKAGLNDTWFAWSGPTTAQPGRNITAYYRIQGPKLVIEYSPQQLGGDPSMHVHAMYRDPTNDYGRGLTKK